MEGYGERLKFSIFGCRLTPRERQKLHWQLEKVLTEEDDLLIIGLCNQCIERVRVCNRSGAWPVSQQNYKETYRYPPPSTVYGLLLSLVGEVKMDKHRGVKLALGIIVQQRALENCFD
ncbi:CRISPR-associated endonuclease Cas2 [Thermosynechococcus vestitus]|uniref:CRISPR-associated endonuclease Cas2 n=1 Tax=Thermosynechococcus vestitus TaxID=146786 RepID=UPI0022B22B7F|nr:CRISPR-associated endonuclease Cas2 [Thermosynechococcus vestitus]